MNNMMELLSIPASERPRYREGAAQLMDLGWPTNYIDFGMIDRLLFGACSQVRRISELYSLPTASPGRRSGKGKGREFSND